MMTTLLIRAVSHQLNTCEVQPPFCGIRPDLGACRAFPSEFAVLATGQFSEVGFASHAQRSSVGHTPPKPPPPDLHVASVSSVH